MARVKDLWFAKVPFKDADGKTVRDDEGRVVYVTRKTSKHPDRGGNKKAKRYLAIWTDPDGKEVTQAFARQIDAERHAKKMEADADRDDYVSPKAGKEKFGDLAKRYLRLRAVGGTSREKYERVYRNQVETVFAGRRVSAVRASEILEWMRGPEISKLSGSVQNIAYMIVAGTFDLAVADKMRRDNPARSQIVPTPPRGDPPHRDPWTPERVWKVIDAHPERYRAIPVCAAGLGLRQGEALALAENDFHFESGKVEIRRQLVRVGREWFFKLPKEGKERTVPLSRGVAAIVKAHIEAYAPQAYELPWLNEDGELADEPHACRLLFRWASDDPRTNGKHVKSVRYDHSLWNPALAAAGIIAPPVQTEKGTVAYKGGAAGNGTHILRHFYSTTLQDAGVSLAGVMDFMGHSKKGQPVTLGVYGNVTEETFEQGRQAIDKTLFRLRPVKPAGTVTELRTAQ
jgi:integrase